MTDHLEQKSNLITQKIGSLFLLPQLKTDHRYSFVLFNKTMLLRLAHKSFLLILLKAVEDNRVLGKCLTLSYFVGIQGVPTQTL